MALQPRSLEFVGDFLAVKWTDDSESIVRTATLRSNCPCAQCAGEPDVTGAVRRPAAPPTLSESSAVVTATDRVGSYAIGITWGDGHRTGIYSWALIRELAELDEE